MPQTTTSMLSEIAEMLPQIALLTTTRAPGMAQTGSSSTGSKAPINLAPIALEQDIHSLLSCWVRIAVEDALVREGDWPENNSLSMCLWLQNVAEDLDAHEAGKEWMDEMSAITSRCRTMLGEKHLRLLCPDCGAKAKVDRSEGWLNCPEGHETPISGLMDRVMSRPAITTKKVCEEFNLDPNTLKQWRFRNRVTPSGKDGREMLWNPWDIFRLVYPELAAEVEWAVEQDRRYKNEQAA